MGVGAKVTGDPDTSPIIAFYSNLSRRAARQLQRLVSSPGHHVTFRDELESQCVEHERDEEYGADYPREQVNTEDRG